MTLSHNTVTLETTILIETAKWLVKKGYILESISVPRGLGYSEDIKPTLEKELRDLGYSKKIKYSPNGADIIAENGTEIWKIECKGKGSGTSQTLRNNFDRALASVVTYFDSENKYQFLALAIPNSPSYLNQLTRISKFLRKTLNLWILLIDETDHAVTEYKPDDDIEGVVKKLRRSTTYQNISDIQEALKKESPEFLRKILSQLKNN